MNTNEEFTFRTEELSDEELRKRYVESRGDRENINLIKSKSPILLVGSRGTGKTMILKVAEKELDDEFNTSKVLGVFVSFRKSIFLERVKNPIYFRQWMMAKTIFALIRKIEKKGLALNSSGIFERYFEVDENHMGSIIEKLNKFTKLLEKSSKGKDIDLPKEIELIMGIESDDIEVLNELDYFNALIEDLCEELKIDRIVLLFDEASHNFIPSQQREFFTLFRDLMSPIVSCKAAVYPGITSYGTFQKFHDAKERRIEKDIHDLNFTVTMREIVKNQVSEDIYTKIERQGELFDCLIYSSAGNPRLLLKSILLSIENKFNNKGVNDTIKEFYRTSIWNEHTKLAEIYSGHKPLIDWGRHFIENIVLVETNQKNETRKNDVKKQQTIYFAIHRDAPEQVKHAIRILEYSGIVSIHTEGTKVRGEIFDRYQINFGVVLSTSQTPINYFKSILEGLSIKLYTDYGMNSPAYNDIICFSEENINFDSVIDKVLETSIEKLDITEFQRESIKRGGFNNLGDILEGKEEDLQRASNIGPKRARYIWNAAYNATMEYFSG